MVGVVAGLLATAFRLALAFAEGRRASFLLTFPMSERIPIAITLGAAGGALGVWLVRRFAPDASGSGISAFSEIESRDPQLALDVGSVVDQASEVIHFSPNASRLLRLSGGTPSTNLLQLIHPMLRATLRAGLSQASKASRILGQL